MIDYPLRSQRKRALVKLLIEIKKEPDPQFPQMGGFGDGGGKKSDSLQYKNSWWREHATNCFYVHTMGEDGVSRFRSSS